MDHATRSSQRVVTSSESEPESEFDPDPEPPSSPPLSL